MREFRGCDKTVEGPKRTYMIFTSNHL